MTSQQNQSSNIPSIDPSAIARLKKMGSDVLVVKMIDLFLENIPQKIDIMKRAIQDNDFQSLEMAAHSLKSSAGNIGAKKLQKTANDIESLAHKKESKLLGKFIDSIITESSEVLDTLKKKKSEYL